MSDQSGGSSAEDRSVATENDVDRLEALLAAGVEDETFSGAVAAVGSADGIDRLVAVGEADPERGIPTRPDTVFDAASLTKPVVTATVVLSLVERGVLALSDPLSAHVPELAERERGDVSLESLLTHTSGLEPYAFSSEWETAEAALGDIYTRDLLDAEPGDRVEYSCLNYVHLADVATRATDRQFSALARDLVFDPAGMTDSRMGPLPEGSDAEVAVTYDREYRDRTLRGEIHDPIAWAFAGESGNAGLFTTATDLVRFARAILDGGGDLLSSASVTALSADRTPAHEESRSLGWKLVADGASAPGWSNRTVGHTGYTGTSLRLDLECDRFAVLLTNEVYYGKDGNLANVREAFHRLVADGR